MYSLRSPIITAVTTDVTFELSSIPRHQCCLRSLPIKSSPLSILAMSSLLRRSLISTLKFSLPKPYHNTHRTMSDKIITAYSNAIPEKQTQSYPGLDKDIKGGVEYTKQEVFDNEGKPSLVEYQGSGKCVHSLNAISFVQADSPCARLKGKTAIVTGGDSGIGRAAAAAFSREGAKGITITYLTPELEDAQDAKKLLEDGGAEVQIIECDLKNEEDAKRVVDAHIKKWGTVDVLVNNASQQLYVTSLPCPLPHSYTSPSQPMS